MIRPSKDMYFVTIWLAYVQAQRMIGKETLACSLVCKLKQMLHIHIYIYFKAVIAAFAVCC